MSSNTICIRGACQHNLQNVDLDIPKNSLTVLTGVSGSGKSSLAFDTLHAEGQRRYVESLSSYARQFLDRTPKPAVQSITGLAPAISIEQKGTGHNPRSTVGTITEIYDYLRVVFAAIGKPHCPECGTPISAQTVDQVVAAVLALPAGATVHLLAPVVRDRKGEFKDLFADMRRAGYARARVDGAVVALDRDPDIDKSKRHSVDIVVDRGVIGSTGFAANDSLRIAEAAESAARLAEGAILVEWEHRKETGTLCLNTTYSCAECNKSFAPPSHAAFSFNTPQGMCPNCGGLGTAYSFVPDLLIPDPDRSLLDGAIPLMPSLKSAWHRHFYEGVARHYGFTLKTPLRALTREQRTALLYGSRGVKIEQHFKDDQGRWERHHAQVWEGVVPLLLKRHRQLGSDRGRKKFEAFMRHTVCPDCGGGRLNPVSLAVKLGGRSIADLNALSIDRAQSFFGTLSLSETEQRIAGDALREVRDRLQFLLDVGLHYLTLDRTAPTLSGGEAQRIRLASQVGSGLVGVIYILDEPSIGLHNRDNIKLLNTLCALRDRGNTVVVVEHDEETMRAADYLVDFGLGAGEKGGQVVAAGPVEAVMRHKDSLTARYLRRELTISTPTSRRKSTAKALTVHGARQNNLKDLDVRIPLGLFTCITGVSGSGKSSLVNGILYPALAATLNGAEGVAGEHDRISGINLLDKVIEIDQSPIGRTPRSNPATYVGIFDCVRSLLAEMPEARMRGYTPGRFSFNVKDGRCETCEGNGSILLEMDFLADVWVECEQCGGKRFSRETLEVEFKGKNVAQILEMSVTEALEHFRNHKQIYRMLTTLHDVGLDYLRLGQPAPTLSGGEAQRIKLASELCRASTGRTLYVLDEPTTGLHFHDIDNLLRMLHRLVDEGNTVVVVEHNLDVIKTADHVIDLGPEGGDGGGRIVAEGTPEQLAACVHSHTGEALKVSVASESRRRGRVAARPRVEAPGVQSSGIVIRNARENNLRNVSMELPRGKISVLCGPSGSGKTSLALDTLFAEGQRRYISSLSTYARQFLGQVRKPAVDMIEGLSPAIAIEQRMSGHTPRSTVGTVTEIYDYLRALYARMGTQQCPECNRPAEAHTATQMVSRVVREFDGKAVTLLSPVKLPDGETVAAFLGRMRADGYHRIRINGALADLNDGIPRVNKKGTPRFELVMARVAAVAASQRDLIADAVEKGLALSRGWMRFSSPAVKDELTLTTHLSCPGCLRAFAPIEPRALSFNHSQGWCPACEGLGLQRGVDSSMAVASSTLSVRDGALRVVGKLTKGSLLSTMIEAVADRKGISLDTPWYLLSDLNRNSLMHGTGDEWYSAGPFSFQFVGINGAMDQAAKSFMMRSQMRQLVHDMPCPVCKGARVNPVAAAVTMRGQSLVGLCAQPLEKALAFFEALRLTPREKEVSGDIIEEVCRRLHFLVDVGLEYVALHRSAPTLSGGESQRIRLASQIGSGLTGVLYVLDEPTIGLHPCDNARLRGALTKLRDLGNTLVLVEHDRDTVENADYLVDFGPGAGPEGGRITASGTPAQVTRVAASLTGQYLAGTLRIPTLKERRKPAAVSPKTKSGGAAGWLTVVGARQNNLANTTVRFPLGVFTCVTGPSGSGKSTLVNDILYNALAAKLNRADTVAGLHNRIDGTSALEKVIRIDQTPIGQGHRSDPSTYTGVFDQIRGLYARLPDAKMRGYSHDRFSYNRPGGRCEACHGLGSRCIEMHFLPDAWVECDACQGARFNRETLSVRYRGKSIAEVLSMSVDEALEHFALQPTIRRTLLTMRNVGLGYLKLGQPAGTLSGGEAQRIKLARELSRPSSGRTLYLLDEPTTGLHLCDIQKLLIVLHRLVEAGNSVVVIEHNMEVAKSADWVIDMGPGGGELGGRIVAEGTPEEVAKCRASVTAPFLRAALTNSVQVSRSGLLASTEETEVAPAEDASVDPTAKSPWEADGRAWHLNPRTIPGRGARLWQGDALRALTDATLSLHKSIAIQWNSRTYVAASYGDGRSMLFLRARTDETGWFRVFIRTSKGHFDVEDLRKRLDLPVWNDVKELHVYGKWPRVHIQTRNPKWDEVILFLWCRAEIETPVFRRFLKESFADYRSEIDKKVKP